METVGCNICRDEGYLDTDVYCECPAGVFYNLNDEIFIQKLHGELDGLQIDSHPEPDISCEDWFEIYSDVYLELHQLHLLSMLPFYEGTYITDNTYYDDSDYETEHIDMQLNYEDSILLH